MRKDCCFIFKKCKFPTLQVTNEVEVEACEGSGDTVLAVAARCGLMKNSRRLEAASKIPANA